MALRSTECVLRTVRPLSGRETPADSDGGRPWVMPRAGYVCPLLPSPVPWTLSLDPREEGCPGHMQPPSLLTMGQLGQPRPHQSTSVLQAQLVVLKRSLSGDPCLGNPKLELEAGIQALGALSCPQRSPLLEVMAFSGYEEFWILPGAAQLRQAGLSQDRKEPGSTF